MTDQDNHSAKPPIQTRRLSLGLGLGLVLAVVAVFGGVADHHFLHFDDAQNIVGNPHVDGLTAENVRWMFTDTTYAPRYMPLGWFCYALERQLWGLNPRAWHVGNLLLHVANTLLLFALLQKLARIGSRENSPSVFNPTPSSQVVGRRQRCAVWCAGAGALFWAVNPLRVEAVAWASSRIYEVVFLFTMVWLLAWLRARLAQEERERRVWAWISLGAYAASLLTYPLALFAPVALFALEVFPLRRAPQELSGWLRRGHWPLWRDKIPFLLMSAAVLAITFAARIGAMSRFRPATLAEFGLSDRLMQAFYVLAYYAWKPWAPFDLAATYPTLHAFNPWSGPFLASAAAVVLFTGVALACHRRWPAMLAVWVCHLVILVPVLGLSEYPHSAYDRYNYLPGVLWSAVLTLGLQALRRDSWRTTLYGASVALTVGCFAVLSWVQVPAWRNTITLYQGIVARFGEHPSRGRFDEVLGVYYLRASLTNDALASLNRAIHYEAWRTDRHRYDEGTAPRCERRIGDVLLAQGDHSGAATHYTTALETESNPANIVTLSLKLSEALTPLGRAAESLPWLRKSLESAPNNPELHRQLAVILQRTGQEAQPRPHSNSSR